MADVKITVYGADKVKQFLKDKNTEALRKVQEALNQSVLFLEGEIKRSIAQGTNAPRAFDTGRFMRATTSQVKGLTGYVQNDVEYGPYIEYGTSKMPARPHFRNTVAVNKHKVDGFMKDKIKGL